MSATSHSLSSTNKPKTVPVKTFEGHKERVWCVTWHPDGRRIVSGSWDGELRVWDTQTGLPEGESIKGHDREVWALDVSPDGTIIASGSEDRTVRLWDSQTGQLIHTCRGHEGWVRVVHFSPDSKQLVSCSFDHTLRIWDVQTGKLAFKPVECNDAVWAVCYSPKGDRIASGADDIRIWSVSDGGVELVITINWSVPSLAWMHRGEQIVAGEQGKITIWNASSGEQIRTWEAHEDWVRPSLSPTTTHLATCNWSTHEILVFDTDTGEKIAECEHDGTINCVAYSPSGNFIAIGCEDKKVYIWEAPRNSPSPGSSILDLPATLTKQGNAQVCDQFIKQMPPNSMFDLPAVTGASLSVQPTHQTGHQHRRTFLKAISAIFRRRRSSTDDSKRDQEDRTSEANRIAESRTRPIYAFETGPLPDEVERGCLFHLASYICYGRRDPNVAVLSYNAPTSAIPSAPGMPPSTSEVTATDHRSPHTYPPAPVMTTALTVPNASATSLTAHMRALLDRPFTSLRHRLNPTSRAVPIVPAIVVTGLLPESTHESSGGAFAQPASSALSPSTNPIVPSSALTFTPTVSTSPPSAAGPVVKPIDIIPEVPHNNAAIPYSASGQSSPLDVSSVPVVPSTSDRPLQPSSSGAVAPLPLHHDPAFVLPSSFPMDTSPRSLGGVDVAPGTLSYDEIALVQGLRI